MNEEIKRILGNSIKVEESDIPVAHLKYNGKSKTYITWTIISETPAFSYEDEIQYSTTIVDIDIYSDSNYLKIMSSIKKIMKENEWIWKEDSQEMYESDTGLHHRTCSFEKGRNING